MRQLNCVTLEDCLHRRVFEVYFAVSKSFEATVGTRLTYRTNIT